MNEEKPKIRTIGSLSWEERKAMITEYLTGQYSKVEIWNKYTGQTKESGHMLQWMRKLGYLPSRKSSKRQSKPRTLLNIKSIPLKKAKDLKDPQAMKKYILELEQQLEMTRLQVEGYEIMIETAEKQFNIPIRKKSGTR